MEETATTRTVWGRTLELVPCAGCGEPLMTTAQLAVTAARGGLPKEQYELCDDVPARRPERRTGERRARA